MKKNKLLRALSLADEKYVDEANPAKVTKKFKGMKIALSIAACFIVAVNLWLFLPVYKISPSMSKYSDSEYYSIIVKLNELTRSQLGYTNNYERYVKNSFIKTDAEIALESVEDGAEITGASYVEVTDNQVASVIEGDRIKRSDKHIFYLRNDRLDVYSIDKENSERVGTYELSSELRYGKRVMYLSADVDTVTVFINNSEGKQSIIQIVSLDVSDVTDIKEKSRAQITGSYLSSRLTDGDFLLFSSFYVGNKPDFSDEKTFVPQIDTGGGYRSIPIADIISPDKLSTAQYTVVCRFDGDTLDLVDSTALLSYTTDIYISEDNMYIPFEYYVEEKDDGEKIKLRASDITAISYSEDGFDNLGTVTIKGYIKDQYSMDEYDGILRVVTTTETRTTQKSSTRGEIWSRTTNADLYCIDFDTDSVVASVISFAPDGETVRSVRFDGASAYVCTAIQVTDPVFFFDLSDLDNITVKDTGNIEGYSTSLINFAEGYLVGIGYNGYGDLKVEVYSEGETGVDSVCKYEYKGVYFSENYKSYYIDRKNGLIGLGIEKTKYCSNKTAETDGRSRYLVIKFDGERLIEMLDIYLEGDNAEKRGVYIDGYMYMFGGKNGFEVGALS